jgi:MFS family permease
MTRDDFLEGLRDDWRRAPVDLSQIRALTTRRQLWVGLLNLLSLAGALVAPALGLWFVWRAIALQDAIAAIGALALFVAAPALWLEYVEGRRTRKMRYDDTPRGVLLQARQQLAFSRRMQLGCRMCAIILGTGAAALLLLGLIDAGSARRAFVTASAWGVTAAGTWMWGVWRRRRIERESAQCEALLGDLDAEEGPDPGES